MEVRQIGHSLAFLETCVVRASESDGPVRVELPLPLDSRPNINHRRDRHNSAGGGSIAGNVWYRMSPAERELACIDCGRWGWGMYSHLSRTWQWHFYDGIHNILKSFNNRDPPYFDFALGHDDEWSTTQLELQRYWMNGYNTTASSQSIIYYPANLQSNIRSPVIATNLHLMYCIHSFNPSPRGNLSLQKMTWTRSKGCSSMLISST